MQHRWQFSVLRWLFLYAVMFSLVGGSLFAQNTNNRNQNNTNRNQSNTNRNQTGTGTSGTGTTGTGSGNNSGVGNTDDIGTANSNRGGVLVNAGGVLSRSSVFDVGQLSQRQRDAAIRSYSVSGDTSTPSTMRCISLNRLEKAIADAKGWVTDEQAFLAGIQRITHVFYFPESKDIVIAGPAEGWFPGPDGIMVGRQSLQPVCELQDLVLALRTYAPGKEVAEAIGCSIDPTKEGSARLARFQRLFSGSDRQAFVRGVRESIGMQTIQVHGIPATTHAAHMMVAADYRMKRIGLGLDNKPVPQLRTFIDHTVPNTPDAAFRWFFVPDYESVVLTEDRTGMALIGDGVKLVAENEIVSSAGERMVVSGELDPGSAAYTRSFTQLFPEIAERAPVFAQLRNWIDMLVCAAHIQREDFYGKSGWSMEFFACEEKYSLEVFTAPQEVEPLVGQREVRERRAVLTLAPVGGGIVIDAEQALDVDNAKSDKDKKVTTSQQKIALHLPKGAWWWDVQ